MPILLTVVRSVCPFKKNKRKEEKRYQHNLAESLLVSTVWRRSIVAGERVNFTQDQGQVWVLEIVHVDH